MACPCPNGFIRAGRDGGKRMFTAETLRAQRRTEVKDERETLCKYLAEMPTLANPLNNRLFSQNGNIAKMAK